MKIGKTHTTTTHKHSNADLNRVTAFAAFNALVQVAQYHSAGRFQVVAFSLKEEGYTRLYVGDSRHLYGCVSKGLHPVCHDRVDFNKTVQVAKAEWMDRNVTTGMVRGYVHRGRMSIRTIV